MKFKPAVLALAIAAFVTSACEKHSWSESKQLFESHDKEAHGEKAAEHGQHKAEGHEEKK
jgi:hypothetical protein